MQKVTEESAGAQHGACNSPVLIPSINGAIEKSILLSRRWLLQHAPDQGVHLSLSLALKLQVWTPTNARSMMIGRCTKSLVPNGKLHPHPGPLEHACPVIS